MIQNKMGKADDDALKAVSEVSMLPRNEEQPRPTYNEENGSSDDGIKKAVVPHLASATLPPDAPWMPTTHDDEVALPSADEELAGIASMNTSGNTGTAVANTSQEQAYPAFLAPDPAEARRRALEQAVSATNVHVIEKTRKKQERFKWAPALLIVALASVAAIAISISLTLGRREDFTPSLMPTPAPTSERFGQVAALVEPLSGEAPNDPSSPQFQAAQWMADVDTMFDNDLSTVDTARFLQRYVLAVLYYATGGPDSWIETSFFLQPDAHECDWRDTARNDTASYSNLIGVYNCSSEQWVQGLEINQNNLTGTLPQELGSLSTLTELTVMGNAIDGALPSSLFTLPNIRTVDIEFNFISGSIPSEIGRARSLTKFHTYRNVITGTIPSEIGELADLVELGLGNNMLTGTIPELLVRLKKLKWLNLEANALTGQVAPSFFSTWPELEAISVQMNYLTGTIPNELTSFPFLDWFNAESNNFTGPFPSSITALTKVRAFSVGENDITGTLPNDWSNLSATLEYLRVHSNRLSGTLPESLGNLSPLRILWLQENEFNKTLPESLGNDVHLESVGLQVNNFAGTVPESFSRLASVRVLKLHRNELTGDMSFLCNNDTEVLHPELFDLSADCLGEVYCPCCDHCCNANNTCVDVVH